MMYGIIYLYTSYNSLLNIPLYGCVKYLRDSCSVNKWSVSVFIVLIIFPHIAHILAGPLLTWFHWFQFITFLFIIELYKKVFFIDQCSRPPV